MSGRNSKAAKAIIESLAKNTQEERCSDLAKSLSDLRNSNPDIHLVTRSSKRFPAHRLILQASSSYFMETLSNHTDETLLMIYCKDGVMEAILDFIYTGSVLSLQSEANAANVIRPAHNLGLVKLEQFCLYVLWMSVSVNSLLELWSIADYCKNKSIIKLLCDYVMDNIDEVLQAKLFLHFSLDQLQLLLKRAKEEGRQMDQLLHGTFIWLRKVQNEEDRINFAKELIPGMDGKLVSKTCWKTVVEDDRRREDGIMVSQEIAVILHDLLERVTFYKPTVVDELLKTKWQRKGVKLMFLSKYRVERYFNEENILSYRQIPSSTIQYLDLYRLKWDAPRDLPIPNVETAAICPYKDFICFAGGSENPKFIMYNEEKGELSTPMEFKYASRTNATLCVFNDEFYFIGGQHRNKKLRSIFCSAPGRKEWKQVVGLQHPLASPTVLTSSKCIYVYNPDMQYVQQLYFADGFDYLTGRTIINLTCTVNMNFFISCGTLKAVYSDERDVVHVITYDNELQQSLDKEHKEGNTKKVTSIITFPGIENPYLFVRTKEDILSPLPDAMLNPNNNYSYPLPAFRGDCNIFLPESKCLPYVVQCKELSGQEQSFCCILVGCASLLLNSFGIEVFSVIAVCLFLVVMNRYKM